MCPQLEMRSLELWSLNVYKSPFAFPSKQLKGGRQAQTATGATWLTERPSLNSSHEKQINGQASVKNRVCLTILQVS